MNIQVIIEPHERYDALEAYKDWLSPAQRDEINGAPEGALVGLQRINSETFITVIEEG